MTTEQLQKTIHAQPFRPFYVRLADSRSLPVPHPEFISHIPGRRTVVVHDIEEDASDVVDLLLIVSLQLEPALAAE